MMVTEIFKIDASWAEKFMKNKCDPKSIGSAQKVGSFPFFHFLYPLAESSEETNTKSLIITIN